MGWRNYERLLMAFLRGLEAAIGFLRYIWRWLLQGFFNYVTERSNSEILIRDEILIRGDK